MYNGVIFIPYMVLIVWVGVNMVWFMWRRDVSTSDKGE